MSGASRLGSMIAVLCALTVVSGCSPAADNTTQGNTGSSAQATSGGGNTTSPPLADNTTASAPPSPTPSNSTPGNSTPASPPVSSPPASPTPVSNGFSFTPAGQLVPGSGGTGIADNFQWVPDLVFPVGDLPAYANSQVWGHGGSSGPGGAQCDKANYSYPWHDNFCESRSHDNHRCASAHGHQGQDIRPATCKIKVHPVVAAEAGVITNIGSFSVTLTGDSGRIYRYLHIDMAEAKSLLHAGQHLNPGDAMGHVSHDFGSTPTTIHLHFEIIVPTADDAGPGYNFVPGYTSLVAAYQRALTHAGIAG